MKSPKLLMGVIHLPDPYDHPILVNILSPQPLFLCLSSAKTNSAPPSFKIQVKDLIFSEIILNIKHHLCQGVF